MKYECEKCKFETVNLYDFNRHKQSKKHIEKCNEEMVKSLLNPGSIHDKESHTCCFCGKIYSTAGNLTKHKKICTEKILLIKELNEKDQKIDHLEHLLQNEVAHIKSLQDEVLYLKTIINNAGNIIKSSVSAISYVSQHYDDAPPIAPIKDYSKITFDIDPEEGLEDVTDNDKPKKRRKRKSPMEIRDSKDKFIEILTCKFDKDILHRYLGDIIIKCYKKKDPTKQSLWSSDTSLLLDQYQMLFYCNP